MTTPRNDVWVIVRCFNEQPMVGDVIRKLRTEFPNVVGVDDGSADLSSEVMHAAGARVVRHAINLGAGAALQTGLTYALLDRNARYFVCFDADDQHAVADAVAMVDRARSEDLDAVVGSRFVTEGRTVGMSRLRGLTLKAGSLFERVTSGVRLTDPHNGLRVFNRAFATKIDLSMSDMAYASELAALIARDGVRYAEHPVTVTYTEYSVTKGQRSINAVNIAMDMWLHQMLRGRRR